MVWWQQRNPRRTIVWCSPRATGRVRTANIDEKALAPLDPIAHTIITLPYHSKHFSPSSSHPLKVTPTMSLAFFKSVLFPRSFRTHYTPLSQHNSHSNLERGGKSQDFDPSYNHTNEKHPPDHKHSQQRSTRAPSPTPRLDYQMA